jgi:DNA repair exonuclease SbcCD ATPase subunit
MADTLIFKIDTTPTVSALQDVNDLLTQSKTKLKELTDAGKQQTNEYISQNAEVKALEKEQRALNNVLVQQTSATKIMTKATEDNIKAGKAQENSIAENRKAYNALYNQLIQTAKPTEEQIKTAKELNTVLKEQEKALGNNTRNVGNYEGSFKSAISEIKIFGVSLGDLENTYKTYNAALQDGKEKLATYITGQKAADGATKLSILSTGGLSAAMNVLKLALIATGVGAFVVLLGSLVAAFASTERGADLLEDALANVTGVFQSLFGEAQKIGVELINVFSNPKKAITDLVDFLKNNLINRLQGFKVVLDGILERDPKKLTDGISQITTGITNLSDKIENAASKTAKFIGNAADRAQKIVQIQRELEDLEGAIAKRRAETASRETELLLIAKRASSTAKERKAATDEILKNTADLQKLEEDIVSKKIQELKLTQSQNITDRKGNKELQDLEAELIKVRDAGKDKQLQLIKILNKEEKSATKEKTADANKAAKDEEDRLNKLAEKNAFLEELRIKTLLSGQEQEEALFQLAFEKRFEDLVALNLSETQIEEIKQKELKAIRDKYSAEDKAAKDKEFNDKIAFNQKELELDLNAVDLSVGTEEQKAKRKAEIQIAALEEQLRLTKEFLGADGIITEEEKQGIKAIEQAIAKAKEGLKPKEGDPTVAKALGLDPEAVEQAQETLSQISKGLQAVTDIVNAGFETRLNNIDATKNAEIDAINQSTASEEDKAKKIQEIEREAAMARYDIELKQFQANKATSIIQTIINTAQAVMAQLLAPPPAGFIFAGLAAATGAAQLALIASQPAPPRPAFATGVIGLDGAGTATSDSIDARLSRGESVMTAKATERFAPVLAQMEMAVGNRPNFQLGNRKFATGYIPTTDGGYSDRAMSNEVNNASTMAKMVSDSIAKMPQPKLVYDEFTNFVNNRNQSVNLSEL